MPRKCSMPTRPPASPPATCSPGFGLADILYWVKTAPDFAAQAVYLEDRYETGLDAARPETWKPSMAELKASGVKAWHRRSI